MKKYRKLLLVFTGLLTIGLLALGILALWVHGTAPALSDERFRDQKRTLVILAADGMETARFSDVETRLSFVFDRLSEDTKNAFLAAEDARFYRHHGIDPKRMIAALLADIRAGELAQGASTITQQLVKLTHLSPEKTWKRKLWEIDLALQTERRYEKDEIFAMYLDTVYFGAGYYGIEAAAQGYFGHGAAELSLSEAALLAGILHAPEADSPIRAPRAAKDRRDLVLERMEELEMISADQCTRAKAAALALCAQKDETSDWYTDAVLAEASDVLGISLNELYSGGYRIQTALDTDLQEFLTTLPQEDGFLPTLTDGTPAQCACVIMDNEGEVIAMLGGASYTVRLGFNNATDARRQPGSLIKPFAVYAPALDSGAYFGGSIVTDAPMEFGGYRPKNFGGGYSGALFLTDALANSVNVPAAALLYEIGIDRGMDYAARAGLPLTEEDATLALALGGLTEGVTPTELCAAYAALSAEGVYHPPHLIRSVTDRDGNILYTAPKETRTFLPRATAFQLTEMLRAAAERGTARGLTETSVRLAAKTGTVDRDGVTNSDVWAAAYNPEYTALFWFGGTGTADLPASVTGGTAAVHGLNAVFRRIYPDGCTAWFEVPSELREVTLERTGSLRAGEARLATRHTPERDRVTFYVPKETEILAASDYWTPPAPPEDISIALDRDGVPVLTFSMNDGNAFYEILRRVDGEETVVATLDGTEKNAVFRDASAPVGRALSYSVRGIHKESGEAGACSGEYRTVRLFFYPSNGIWN